MPSKQCNFCKRILELSEFSVRRASLDGLSHKCRKCHSEYGKTRYYTDSEFRLNRIAKSVEWGKKNKQKRQLITRKNVSKPSSKLKRAASSRARYARNIQASRLCSRLNQHRRKTLVGDLTVEVVNVLLSIARGRCVYCGRIAALTLDHFIPIKNGGTNDWENIIPCCRSCNSSKGKSECSDWLYAKHGNDGLVSALMFMKSARKVIRRFFPRHAAAAQRRVEEKLFLDNYPEIEFRES